VVDVDRLVYDFTWDPGFPKGYGHTSISYLKARIGYEKAKNGDKKAADSVVRQCIKHSKIQYIRQLYPNAVLFPVLGINKLPLALAEAIGLPVCTGIYVIQSAKRKELTAMQRLLNKPQFYIRYKYFPPCEYIIVDDIVTQGGMVAELRRRIIISGGKVLAIVALAYATGSHNIAPIQIILEKIANKFDETELTSFLTEYNITSKIEELTNSQCRYLMHFKSISNIKKKANKNL